MHITFFLLCHRWMWHVFTLFKLVVMVSAHKHTESVGILLPNQMFQVMVGGWASHWLTIGADNTYAGKSHTSHTTNKNLLVASGLLLQPFLKHPNRKVIKKVCAAGEEGEKNMNGFCAFRNHRPVCIWRIRQHSTFPRVLCCNCHHLSPYSPAAG